MKETKNEYEEEYADQLGVVQNKLRAYLDEKDLERAAEAKKELEILYALSPENVSYPAWPFDTQVLVKFLMPQIIPFLSFVAGIESDAGKDMLLEFLSAFFGG